MYEGTCMKWDLVNIVSWITSQNKVQCCSQAWVPTNAWAAMIPDACSKPHAYPDGNCSCIPIRTTLECAWITGGCHSALIIGRKLAAAVVSPKQVLLAASAVGLDQNPATVGFSQTWMMLHRTRVHEYIVAHEYVSQYTYASYKDVLPIAYISLSVYWANWKI